MAGPLSRDQKIQRGAEDAGQYFRHMADFVGFTREDADAIRESGLVIEKHLPGIVAQFYAHLLRYAPTRKHFIRPDGVLDQDYLQLRMHHLTNFWRKTASGEYDDNYARYVDYVGRAHTSNGADPQIYIAERYVIGQVGFIQHAISEVINKELHEYNPDLEARAQRAWNLLMMVILEMLSRAYVSEHHVDFDTPTGRVNHEAVYNLALETYELGLGLERPPQMVDVMVGREDEIPEGERKIVQAGALSIGVFHHNGQWYALRNSCLHRGGPVCTGPLEGDVLTCPWHGYQYNVTNGQLLVDPSAALAHYRVEVQDGEIRVRVPVLKSNGDAPPLYEADAPAPEVNTPREENALEENEFHLDDLPAGQIKLVHVDEEPVAVFNVGGSYYAIHNQCTHAGAPLNQGELDAEKIVCPWHGSCFDVRDGRVLRGPAVRAVQVYRVVLDGNTGRVVMQA